MGPIAGERARPILLQSKFANPLAGHMLVLLCKKHTRGQKAIANRHCTSSYPYRGSESSRKLKQMTRLSSKLPVLSSIIPPEPNRTRRVRARPSFPIHMRRQVTQRPWCESFCKRRRRDGEVSGDHDVRLRLPIKTGGRDLGALEEWVGSGRAAEAMSGPLDGEEGIMGTRTRSKRGASLLITVKSQELGAQLLAGSLLRTCVSP